jgi:hypothetical protein
VPEALELSLGGGERGGVAVPEADDGDPSEEVEIRAPVASTSVAPSPRTNVRSWRA